MSDKLLKVGEYKMQFNQILDIDIDQKDIYRSLGLSAHMIKRGHFKCLKHIENIPEIVENPDYIGINPNEHGKTSIELIKRYDINVLVGIKIDSDNDYLYISTMHDLQESKIQRRLHSGRIKIVGSDVDK